MTHGAFTAGVDAAVPAEVVLARTVAVDAPRALFDLALGLRSVQALAPNTRRAYAADWEAFVGCCHRHGFHPAPASPAAVETFIEFRSPDPAVHMSAAERVVFYKYVKPGEVREPLRAWSLRRALAAIGAVHRWLKFPDPTRDKDVKDSFKINVSGRQLQAQKDPLSWALIERASLAMGEDLWALRDKALVAVAHSTMFRRAELVALTVEDYRRSLGQTFARMRVRKTKADDPK